MAKVPPRPSGKGIPPQPDNLLGNLDKPEPDELVALNFKVPRAFKRDFKLTATQDGKTMNQVLREAVALYKQRSHAPTDP